MKQILKEIRLINRQLTKLEIQKIILRAKKLIGRKVRLFIEFEGYEDSSGWVEGRLIFVGNTSLILDMDLNIRTKKDRVVYHFADIKKITDSIVLK